MSTRDIVCVALRILGIVWLVTGIEEVMQIAAVDLDDADWLTASVGLRATFGLVLMVGTGWVYDLLFSDLADEHTEFDCARLQPMAFSVLGLIVLLRFAPTLVVEVARLGWLLEASRRSLLTETIASDWGDYLRLIIEVLLGWMLFRYSRRISAWWGIRQNRSS